MKFSIRLLSVIVSIHILFLPPVAFTNFSSIFSNSIIVDEALFFVTFRTFEELLSEMPLVQILIILLFLIFLRSLKHSFCGSTKYNFLFLILLLKASHKIVSLLHISRK